MRLSNFDLQRVLFSVNHWISRGKTDGEIGEILRISVRTVQKHVENIFTKLGVETRTAAVSQVL